MRFVLLVLILCSAISAAERWEMQFFHDVEGEEVRFGAIAFCSPSRGVATGVKIRRDSIRPMAVVTSNAGKVWTPTEMDEVAHSLFFFDETSGWMLTESGIWFTDECGRSWRRIHKQRGLVDIHFVSRERGWAVGANKTAIQTSDGGKTWTKVQAVVDLDLTADRTTFHAVAFLSPQSGIIVGRSARRPDNRLPLWLDPEPQSRRERPALSVVLQTRDGGATWATDKVSMFGRISQVQFAPSGRGLALVEFDDFFEFPSELHAMNGAKAADFNSLRRKDFAITNIAAGPVFYAAGFTPPGRIFRGPVPGKVRIARSVDLATWVEGEVDYRAVARRVLLGRSGDALWAATDTGMILNLVRD